MLNRLDTHPWTTKRPKLELMSLNKKKITPLTQDSRDRAGAIVVITTMTRAKNNRVGKRRETAATIMKRLRMNETSGRRERAVVLRNASRSAARIARVPLQNSKAKAMELLMTSLGQMSAVAERGALCGMVTTMMRIMRVSAHTCNT